MNGLEDLSSMFSRCSLSDVKLVEKKRKAGTEICDLVAKRRKVFGSSFDSQLIRRDCPLKRKTSTEICNFVAKKRKLFGSSFDPQLIRRDCPLKRKAKVEICYPGVKRLKIGEAPMECINFAVLHLKGILDAAKVGLLNDQRIKKMQVIIKDLIKSKLDRTLANTARLETVVLLASQICEKNEQARDLMAYDVKWLNLLMKSSIE